MQNVYIDGFNVYYGCVFGTRYKWLDYEKLIKKLVPSLEIKNIYYFTARVRGDPEKTRRQDIYIRALEKNNIKVIYGHFSTQKKKRELAFRRGEYVKVICPEEKKSDVNIACQMLCDAFFDKKCEQLLLVSNDSDLLAPIKIIKQKTQKRIGVVFPVARKGRIMSQEIKNEAHFYRRIKLSDIKECQLPVVLGNIRKPPEWEQ